MAPQYIRGGLPQHFNEMAMSGAVEGWSVAQGVANRLFFRNTGVHPIVLTLTTKADAVAGNGIVIVPGGIYDGPAEIGSFYTTGSVVGNSTWEAVAYRARG